MSFTPLPDGGPTPGGERIGLLDALRGLALGGILLANLTSFFGVDMMGSEARRAMSWGGVGERVLFAIHWLVEGKFYSIFSILLGTGFALQALRADRRAGAVIYSPGSSGGACWCSSPSG